ncbi:hypothetical protein [Neomicrococcus aestuarii]|uniref:Uncharacterized protein n=1 Tax=Neomicrococcus aestuarii TaxID=556325 RepID=A0A1L2ZPI8_9MICC|nr:hypothetical protein [Neomicrococcus aestuarii]APF41353.1 hypothetical protein BHE16_10525 [Neomicrococcus aestuarii]
MPEKTISAPTRRSVAKGIAWSAPVIAAASLAPFAAASHPCAEFLEPTAPAPTTGCSDLGSNLLTQVDYDASDPSDPKLTITQYIHLLLPTSVTVATGEDRQIELTFRLSGVSGTDDTFVGLTTTSTGLLVNVDAVPLGSNNWDIKVILTIPANVTVARDTSLVLTITLSSARVVTSVLGAYLDLQLTGFKTFGGSDACAVPAGFGSLLRIPATVLGTLMSTVTGVLTGGVSACLLGGVLYFAI